MNWWVIDEPHAAVEEFPALEDWVGGHLVKFENSFELVGELESPEPPGELLGDHCTKFGSPDELLGHHYTKFEPLVEVVIDHRVELQSPGELVEHRLKFEVVVKFETSVDHHLGASDSLSDSLSGSVLVAQQDWMALDSPLQEHHSSWMQVLDDGHPVGCEDSSGNLHKSKNSLLHGDSIKPQE